MYGARRSPGLDETPCSSPESFSHRVRLESGANVAGEVRVLPTRRVAGAEGRWNGRA